MQKLESDINWNTMFLNPNAVLTAIASKLNVSKSEIINKEEEDLAVKMALAETQIIKDTKEQLLDQGVRVGVFDETNRKNSKRSDTVIIVKNIPFEITTSKLQEIFCYYGHASHVILPETKSIGIIEFENKNHAKNAFDNLSYFIYKNEPLYLEWAPEGLFDDIVEKKGKKQEEDG